MLQVIIRMHEIDTQNRRRNHFQYDYCDYVSVFMHRSNVCIKKWPIIILNRFQLHCENCDWNLQLCCVCGVWLLVRPRHIQCTPGNQSAVPRINVSVRAVRFLWHRKRFTRCLQIECNFRFIYVPFYILSFDTSRWTLSGDNQAENIKIVCIFSKVIWFALTSLLHSNVLSMVSLMCLH